MKYLSFASLVVFLFTTLTPSNAQNAATAAPLRVAIAGLVHGHVDGFFPACILGDNDELVSPGNIGEIVFHLPSIPEK